MVFGPDLEPDHPRIIHEFLGYTSNYVFHEYRIVISLFGDELLVRTLQYCVKWG